MKKYFTIFVASFCYASTSFPQNSERTKIIGTFAALWAETLCLYEFNLDGTYQYETSGHFGNSVTIGKYRIIHDTIILTASPKSQQRNTSFYFKTDTLIIHNDNCLLDLSLGYEHLRLQTKNDTIYAGKRRNLKLPGRPIIIEN